MKSWSWKRWMWPAGLLLAAMIIADPTTAQADKPRSPVYRPDGSVCAVISILGGPHYYLTEQASLSDPAIKKAKALGFHNARPSSWLVASLEAAVVRLLPPNKTASSNIEIGPKCLELGAADNRSIAVYSIVVGYHPVCTNQYDQQMAPTIEVCGYRVERQVTYCTSKQCRHILDSLLFLAFYRNGEETSLEAEFDALLVEISKWIK